MPEICGAKTRAGTPCQRPPMRGRTRCKLHGGATPRGIAAPWYRTGKYSKYLPNNLGERYAEAVNDPDLLSLNHEIALVDARITTLLDGLDKKESPGIWNELTAQVDALAAAQRSNNMPEAALAITDIMHIVRRGAADIERWQELDAMMQSRRKLVETERRRREAMQLFVTAEQQMNFATAVGMLIRDNVRDPQILRALSEGLIRIVNRTTVDSSGYDDAV